MSPMLIARRSTTAPSTRRKGLSPRAISRTAHPARLAVATTETIVPSSPWGWNRSRFAVAARNSHNGRFGIWATTTSPVSGFRKNLDRTERSDALTVDVCVCRPYPIRPGSSTLVPPANRRRQAAVRAAWPVEHDVSDLDGLERGHEPDFLGLPDVAPVLPDAVLPSRAGATAPVLLDASTRTDVVFAA